MEQVVIIAGQKMPPHILQNVETWEDPSTLVECGGAGGTAGTYTETLDQFDTDDYSEDAIAVTGGTISADLITNADGLVVTAL